MNILDLKGKTTTFNGEKLTVDIMYYNTGNPAIILLAEDGDQYCSLSVNMQPYGSKLTERDWDEKVYIKNYSENEGIANHIINNTDWFTNTGETLVSGFVIIPLWRINNES